MKSWSKFLCIALATTPQAFAEVPNIVWEARGPGGGGALFSPTFDPHRPNRVYVSCDMSELFQSDSLGASWRAVPFQQVTGNRTTKVHPTSDPNVSYTIDFRSTDGVDSMRIKRTTNGGVTWSYLPADPTGNETWYLAVDPHRTNRLLATSYNTLYVSNDGGSTWSSEFTDSTGNGVLLAGAFFSGDNIWVGTGHGLLVSTDGGNSFALSSVPGLPSGRGIVSFCGAEEGGTIRFWALLAQSWWAGMWPEDLFWPHQDVYRIDWGVTNWVEMDSGLPPGPADDGNGIAMLDCARNDIDAVWASGQRPGELPMVFRSANGGASWTEVLLYNNNENVQTGWAGHQGDRQWTYGGGTTGLGVDSINANRAMFSDYGFVHLTTDGGASWRALYVDPADLNPANQPTPKNRGYHSAGIENTTNWRLTWLSPTTIFASYSDIRGTRSTDGGITWGFNYTGHTQNSAYDCILHPQSGAAYLATGTRHDLYQTTTLMDSSIDGADGGVLRSTDAGLTWTQIRDFDDMVYQLLADPNDAERLYALVVNSTNGGVWRTNNLSAGAGASWTKLTNPPRTEGHPYALRLLNDGTLVVTYSARRTGSGFTDSSGVFVSNDGGTTWDDRTHANMHYYTKDITIDPSDPTQSTWYVCVWSGWGGPLTTNNQAGGLYRTNDRGVSWTRIWQSNRVSSITIDPMDANRAFITTEADGLWWTENLSAATPTVEFFESFPFRQPERVYFDPNDPNRVWVTSFGGGTRTGLLPTGVPASVNGWQLF